MLGPGHRQVVGVNDRAREQGRTGEGQQGPGQQEHVRRPRRGGAGGVEQEADKRRQDRGLVDPRRGPTLRERGVAAHEVDRDSQPGRRDHIGQDGDHGPRRPGEGGGRRDDPEPAVGAHGPGLERTHAGATPSSGGQGRPEQDPQSGGQREGADELARRRQPPGGDQGEGGGGDQDLDPQGDGPDALDPRPTLCRTPAEKPAHQEADQAEHTPIVPRRRPPARHRCVASAADKVPQCTLRGSTRC